MEAPRPVIQEALQRIDESKLIILMNRFESHLSPLLRVILKEPWAVPIASVPETCLVPYGRPRRGSHLQKLQ